MRDVIQTFADWRRDAPNTTCGNTWHISPVYNTAAKTVFSLFLCLHVCTVTMTPAIRWLEHFLTSIFSLLQLLPFCDAETKR